MSVPGNDVTDQDKDHEDEEDDHDDVGCHKDLGQGLGSDKPSYFPYLQTPEIPDIVRPGFIHFHFVY